MHTYIFVDEETIIRASLSIAVNHKFNGTLSHVT